MHILISMLKEKVSNHSRDNTVRKIIMFKDSGAYETCLFELGKEGITPYRWIKRINALCFYIQGEDDTWREIEKHPLVHRVETDIKGRLYSIKRCHRVLASQIPWGVKCIHAPEVWPCTQGECVKVAILDTGISPNPDLVIAGGVNVATPGASFFDTDPDGGHGTGVAGVVAAVGKYCMPIGVAPRADIFAVKVTDPFRGFFMSAVIAGIEWSIDNGMDVVNLSAGFLNMGTSDALHSIVMQADREGIVIVAAVSNEGEASLGLIDIPSMYEEVIAVAETNICNRITFFSGRGKVNVAAPGVDIITTDNLQGFAAVRGTSYAAPHVTGTVALMLANRPRLSPQCVRKVLMQTATKLKGFRQVSQGAGLICANLAVLTVGECEEA